MDAFARLFEDPQFYKTVMEATAKAMYFKFKNDKDENKSYSIIEEQTSLPQAAENPLDLGDIP